MKTLIIGVSILALSLSQPVAAQDSTGGVPAADSAETDRTVPPYDANGIASVKEAFSDHFKSSRGSEDVPSVPSPTRTESEISLIEAILLSLQNNPDLAVTKLAPADATQNLITSESVLDTRLRGFGGLGRQRDPSASTFTGPTVTNETTQFSIGAAQTLPTGGQFSLDWDNRRLDTTDPFNEINPQWDSSLRLIGSIPLLNGAGWGAPNISIRISKRLESAAFEAYRADIANHIRKVIFAYWDVARSRQTVGVAQRSVELAERLRADVEQSVKVGVLAPLSLSDANSQVALSTQELIVANKNYLNAGRELRRVVGVDFTADEGAPPDFTPFFPKDVPNYYDISFKEEEAVKSALSRRPELKAQTLRLRAAALSVKLAENSMLPGLNIEGGLGVSGLAGTKADGIVIPGFPNPSDSRFPGGYGSALDRLSSGNYYNASTGLRIEYPLENRQARAEATRQKINLMREQDHMRSLKQSIIEDALIAVSNVEASKKRVKAAQDSVKYTNEALDVARKKLTAGLGTVRDMLESQRDVSRAELTMVDALTEFQNSVAEVYRSRGDLLDHYGVSVDGGPDPS